MLIELLVSSIDPKAIPDFNCRFFKPRVGYLGIDENVSFLKVI
ncbi:MAG: hypothetical protein ACD_4C00022G0006 [uncultured bacterium (gcode 4)]|uniref:Uncharacterized protein n=1 Tax=uncultured bacterium (gcode 4) TaxID=1234023 RepID=K2FW44_9BACT|nr:MAG: hypothetical protein ACD_4C00022G0006 [uncultured bacterium (gcode 4)]